MNPTTVAAARTRRLAAEALAPVYSTSTPAREHLSVVELEDLMYGSRRWSRPMPVSAVKAYIKERKDHYGLSDIDHASGCWCFKG